MRCFVIGSFIGEEKSKGLFIEDCKKIGKALVELEVTLLICSLFEDSIDYYVASGFLDGYEERLVGNIEIFYPELESVKEKVSSSFFNNISKNPVIALGNDITHSWLFAQLQALDSSDLVITMGGKTNASADMLLRLAEGKNKKIIPFKFWKGTAEECYLRNKYKLDDVIQEQRIPV